VRVGAVVFGVGYGAVNGMFTGLVRASPPRALRSRPSSRSQGSRHLVARSPRPPSLTRASPEPSRSLAPQFKK
jgi:hypothetical protein